MKQSIYIGPGTHDVSRSKLRLIFNATLKEKSGYNNLIIAYSRARNLRDSLMKTSLSEPEGGNVSNLLKQLDGGINKWCTQQKHYNSSPHNFL